MIFLKDATSLTVNGIILPMNIDINRYQSMAVSSDGAAKVRDESMFEMLYRVILRENHRNLAAIRAFFLTTTVLSKYPFYVYPDSGVDLGVQDGEEVQVIYWASDFVETMPSWHNYEYQLLLRRVYT